MSPPDADPLAVRALVEAARRGDREAFGRLYGLYGRMVHGVLLARVPRDDVDDLLQEVFVKAMHRLPSLRDPGAFGAWLGSIARNAATDRFRRAPRTVELADDIAAPDAVDEEARAVLGRIRALPEAYREPMVMRLVEGMTGPEIAERTGLTPGSVRVNLHRGYALLRQRLGARP
jgi:RNA polymerase sigma-70 factor (ECF subfamily)